MIRSIEPEARASYPAAVTERLPAEQRRRQLLDVALQSFAERLGLDIEIVDGLAEMDHLSDTYIPVEEMKEEGGERWEMLTENPYLLLEEAGGEAAFRERVLDGFEGVIARNPGRTVAAFCHGGTTSALLNHLLEVADIWSIVPEYCGITRVTASRSGIRTVRSANETAHVRGLLPERL